MHPDLTGLPVYSQESLPAFPADAVLINPTNTELYEDPCVYFSPPPSKPLPIETWKPRLERRIAELATQIGAPKWFRYRFDPSPSPPSADFKISVWSDGYMLEDMQGNPNDSYFEVYTTEEDMLYALFKQVAELMNYYSASDLLARISTQWQEKYLAEKSRTRR